MELITRIFRRQQPVSPELAELHALRDELEATKARLRRRAQDALYAREGLRQIAATTAKNGTAVKHKNIALKYLRAGELA